MESLSLHQIIMMVQITSCAFVPDDFCLDKLTSFCAAEQYLLLGVQLLQDDPYVRAVLCTGAGCRRDGTVLIFGNGGSFTQFGEEGQMVTVLSSHSFILFSLCSYFTQDLWLCKINTTAKWVAIQNTFACFFKKDFIGQPIFIPVSPSVLYFSSSDMPVLKQCNPWSC